MFNFKFGRRASDEESKPKDTEQNPTEDVSEASPTEELLSDTPETEETDPAESPKDDALSDAPAESSESKSPESDPAKSDPPESDPAAEDAAENRTDPEREETAAQSEEPENPDGEEQPESFDLETEYGFEAEQNETDIRGGIFINSLEELSEDDIPLSEIAREAEKTSPFEYVRRIMFWGFLATFLVSSFLLVRNLFQKHQAAKIYQDIQAQFSSTGFSFDSSEALTDLSRTPGLEEDREQRTIRTMTDLLEGAENDADLIPTSSLSAEARAVYEDIERKRAFLQNMVRKNADVYGYIVVPNTGISYPVCLGKDNDYYLNHAVTGEYNPVGCVFADYRCEPSITMNFNTVFYGHNIEDTSVSMFHDVTLFFQKEYFFNYYIYVYTMDGLYIYEPFAVYEAAYDDEYFRVEFSSADEFITFANEAQSLSTAKDPQTHELLSKEFTFTPRDRILTLSTCTNGYYTPRYALHAKLIRTILE